MYKLRKDWILYGLEFLAQILTGQNLFCQEEYYLDSNKNQENREPMRASYFVFENETLAETNTWKN